MRLGLLLNVMLGGLLLGCAAPGGGGAFTESKALLDTKLVEDGRAVRLETVVFRPAGDGPFPVLILNHGSTGNGRDPEVAKSTWGFDPLSEFFAERGWLVVVPYRRGRGQSDGLYDEGFAEERSLGYTCDPDTTLVGAERGLTDIDAAIDAALDAYPEADRSRLLIGGISRGGVLSVAYAGRHPDRVSGVLNFVGGWLGTGCQSARYVNETVFGWGAPYPGTSLWLYGKRDPVYSLRHSGRNHAAFLRDGGQATFLTYGGWLKNGHDIWAHPDLWGRDAIRYLAEIGFAPDGSRLK